ncbi:MAG: hypothetical protein HY420_00040 [Candidatus Kerfeldbacteria bacterium]|nr:hypothetical protein [Candidatus Kerfeldbacteria bacterium]
MAEQGNLQAPGVTPGSWNKFFVDLEAVLDQLGRLFRGGLKNVVGLGAAATVVANPEGRGTGRRILSIGREYVGVAKTWTQTEVEDAIHEGRVFVMVNWFIAPLVNLLLVIFTRPIFHTNILTTWKINIGETFAIWLLVGLYALYFWVRRWRILFAAGAAAEAVKLKWWDPSRVIGAFLASMQLFAPTGVQGGWKVLADFSAKFWGVFYWWVVFGGWMSSGPHNAIPAPFLLIGTFPAIMLVLAENASKHGFKTISGQPILNADGQQEMPRGHRVLNSISRLIIVGLWLTSFAFWLTSSEFRRMVGVDSPGSSAYGEVLQIPLGGGTALTLRPRNDEEARRMETAYVRSENWRNYFSWLMNGRGFNLLLYLVMLGATIWAVIWAARRWPWPICLALAIPGTILTGPDWSWARYFISLTVISIMFWMMKSRHGQGQAAAAQAHS